MIPNELPSNCRVVVAGSLITLVFALTGCTVFRNQQRELRFDQVTLNIRSIGHEGENNQWQSVCELLNRYAYYDCTKVRRNNCQQVGSIRVCDYDSVVLSFDPPISTRTLERLHGDLLALENEGVTLGLKTGTAAADYVGLAVEGTISIRVRISVTPGALLYLERRWEGICEKVATKNNLFEGEISLRKGQEWVFYRTEVQTENDLAERFFRLNILSKESEELSREEFDRLISRP